MSQGPLYTLRVPRGAPFVDCQTTAVDRGSAVLATFLMFIKEAKKGKNPVKNDWQSNKRGVISPQQPTLAVTRETH